MKRLVFLAILFVQPRIQAEFLQIDLSIHGMD